LGRIPSPVAPVKPIDIHPYFDRIQIWLKRPATAAAITKLRKDCGHLHCDNRRARFDGTYRQRLEFKQPGDSVLRWIARRDDALINRAEIALDFIFGSTAQRDDAFEFLHRHLCRRWHGKRQGVRAYRGRRGSPARPSDGEIERANTRYDASRAARNSILFYRQPSSRATGQIDCLHLEWRLKGCGQSGVRESRLPATCSNFVTTDSGAGGFCSTLPTLSGSAATYATDRRARKAGPPESSTVDAAGL
jgi:hypothetical protein